MYVQPLSLLPKKVFQLADPDGEAQPSPRAAAEAGPVPLTDAAAAAQPACRGGQVHGHLQAGG